MDRVLTDRPLKTLFDANLHVGHQQGTISASQDMYDRSLNHAIVEPLRPERDRDRPASAPTRILGDPSQDSLQEFRGV